MSESSSVSGSHIDENSILIQKIAAYHFKRIPTSRRLGDRLSDKCPRCGLQRCFGYHKGGGRYKNCIQCGFDNFVEVRIATLKNYRNRGRSVAEITECFKFPGMTLSDLVDYIENWYNFQEWKKRRNSNENSFKIGREDKSAV